MINVDLITPQRFSFLKKSTICLKSFLFLLVRRSVYLLMLTEVFGAVDTTQMVSWDWETRKVDLVVFQCKSQTCQKLFQQQHFLLRQFFLIVKDQFGSVGKMNMANWDWETQ